MMGCKFTIVYEDGSKVNVYLPGNVTKENYKDVLDLLKFNQSGVKMVEIKNKQLTI